MSRVICLEAVGSTNEYLRQNADLPHGTVVLSDAQTEGRGRLGRSFFSKAGTGVYMSVLLRCGNQPEKAASLTPNLAVAVCRAISTVCGVTPEIKWVNDLMLGGKKICGILCESTVKNGVLDSVVAGIGINVLTKAEDFPDEISAIAGSILSVTGKRVERGRLILELIKEIDLMFEAWYGDERVYLDDYRRLCCVVGKEIRIISPDGEKTAFAEGVSDDFGLVVTDGDGCRRILRSGEISVRI